jgi:hypothetical protein
MPSSKRFGVARGAAAARAAPATALAGWMLLVLVVPRVVRALYPEIWVEDDFYLEGAYLVSIGMRPYLDFVHPHMPVLEWFTAVYIRLFGASHFSIELLNEAAIYATSVMTCALAERAAGRRTAIYAAILYASASLVFRYHVYERECFVGVIVAAAALVAVREDAGRRTQVATIAALMVLACAIKLTALLSAAALVCFMAIGKRRWLDAALVGAGIAAGLGVLSALLYRLYGFEFLFQTFVFHFMKGRQPWTWIAEYPGQILDLIAPLFVLGFIRIAMERRAPPALWLVLSLVGFNYLFFGLLSPTAWGHNYLDFLPYIAIVAGIGLDGFLSSLRQTRLDLQGSNGLSGLRYPAICVAVIAICLSAVTPLVNENWLHGSAYGFGFIGRDELQELSDGLRRASAPDEEVIAPAFICFEAHRRELIRYPETYGVYREAEDEFLRYGFFEARRRLGRQDFFDLIGRTADRWAEPMQHAIEEGKVNAVIPDSSILLLPIARFKAEELSARGFTPYLRTEHFVLWRRPQAKLRQEWSRKACPGCAATI